MIFEYGKTRIYYETHGEAGEYLLLLHGWGGKCESWLPVIRDFSGAHRILVVDFPGHGRSSEPDTPWDVTDYMRSTLALLDALGIQKPTSWRTPSAAAWRCFWPRPAPSGWVKWC